MKKLVIILLILALLAGGIWYFREPILDLLPIDQSGWEEQDGSIYYLNEKGDPLTGWQTIDGKKYYFYSSGLMATNIIGKVVTDLELIGELKEGEILYVRELSD